MAIKSQYPRIILEDFENSIDILLNAIENLNYSSAAACPYSPIMRKAINEAVGSLIVSVERKHTSGPRVSSEKNSEGVNLTPEQHLMKQIDQTIVDIRSLIKSQDSSEASKVSASKFLFDLIQKRLEISERLANIERVYGLEALIKEFIDQHAESTDVAKDFINRLRKLNEQDKGL